MSRKTLTALGMVLALTGCASDSGMSGNSEIFGKVDIIDENGKDITQFCGLSINRDGLLVQKAHVGSNRLKQITCNAGNTMYRIKSASDVIVNVPSDNMAVYFGDVTIALESNGYSVTSHGHSSESLYHGGLPVTHGIMSVGTAEKDWVKTFLGDTAGF